MTSLTGIWGGKGQGKTFQTELIFRAMGVEPVIMSAGELESEKAGLQYGLFDSILISWSDKMILLWLLGCGFITWKPSSKRTWTWILVSAI